MQSPRTRANDLSVEVARRQRQFMESWLQDVRARLDALDAGIAWRVEQHQGTAGGRLLVTANSADAVLVYGLLEPAVRAVNEALSGVGAEDRALVEAHLPRTLIVPLVRDRSLRSEAIDLSTLVLGDESWTPQWWHLAPKPVPDELATAYPCGMTLSSSSATGSPI
jgi:hypothetical protein